MQCSGSCAKYPGMGGTLYWTVYQCGRCYKKIPIKDVKNGRCPCCGCRVRYGTRNGKKRSDILTKRLGFKKVGNLYKQIEKLKDLMMIK